MEDNYFDLYDKLNEEYKRNFIYFPNSDIPRKKLKMQFADAHIINDLERFIRILSTLPIIIPEYRMKKHFNECLSNIKVYKEDYYINSTINIDEIDLEEFTRIYDCSYDPYICNGCYLKKGDEKCKYILTHEDIKKTMRISYTLNDMDYLRYDLYEEYMKKYTN